LSFGQKAPDVFMVAVVAYWVMAFTFFLLHAGSPHYGERTLGLQAALDVIVLAVFMYASGGYRSGVPFLMMTSIAGAGLIGQGRMVLFYAALATVFLLLEQSYRVLVNQGNIGDYFRTGLTSIGFFGSAITARLLARRVGYQKAEQMILSGRLFLAEELHALGVVDVLAEPGEGEMAVHDYIRRESRSRNGALALRAAREVSQPIVHEELMRIAEIWVDAALRLEAKDLRMMERLVARQTGKADSVNSGGSAVVSA
jgi:hypothetical protein